MSSTQRWSIMLPREAPAARTARTALHGWLRDVDGPTVAAAESIVTELVSNAVRFGWPPIQVTVERNAGSVRIEVSDAGTGTPVHRRPDEHGGWGLEIVRKLASRHGTLPMTSGVWCELPGIQRQESG